MKNLVLGMVCLALLACSGGDEQVDKDVREKLERLEKLEKKMRADSIEMATNNTYTISEIGGVMEIPKGWSITDESEEEPIEISEKYLMDKGISYTGSIKFKKDKSNYFIVKLSNAILYEEVYGEEYKIAWKIKSHNSLKNALYKDYTDAGYEVDVSSSKEVIDGLEFNIFHITMNEPGDDALIHRVVYNCYINGFDFIILVRYDNNKDGELIMRILKNSKFKKKSSPQPSPK